MKTLSLELIDNGSAKSLVADNAKIYATGYGSLELLKEAASLAQPEGYDAIRIGSQSWDIAAIVSA